MNDQEDYQMCPTCKKGVVFTERTDGRFMEHSGYRGVLINIPADYPIARCNNMDCRQMLFLDEELVAYTAMLDEELNKHRTEINAAIDRFRKRQKV
jgi:hypothetical protein